MSKTRAMAKQYGRALIQPTTLNTETREVNVVFATETPVTRFGWDEDFNEILVCDASAIRMERADRGLPTMDCHNTDSVFKQVGRTTEVWINDQKEVCARIKFSQRQQVVELFQDITDGIVKDISVGYIVYKYEREEPLAGQMPVYRATDWMPTEISFAPVQADINSGVRHLSTDPEKDTPITKPNTMKRKIEKGNTTQYTVEGEPVKAGDIVIVDDVTGVALADGEIGDVIMLSIIPAAPSGSEPEPDPSEPEPTDDDKPKDEGSRKRMAEISRSTRAAGLADSFAIELFNSNKTIEQCRQSIIEKMTDKTPPINGNHGVGVGKEADEKKRAAIQNALLHRIYPAKFQLESDAREFRGMTLVEMSKELLNERGVSTRGLDKMAVADHVFKRSHSTSDFPLIFEGVIDQILRADYEFAPEFWENIARQTTVSDFRAKSLYQIGGINGMRKVAEGGEIKYTTLTESKETIKIESYAEGISFTRQAYINDDLGAFSIIPASFVRDWNEMRGNAVWGLITSNVKMSDSKSLFHADHGNLITGADSALSEPNLAKAKVMFSKQKSIAGRSIRILPKFLIVSPELELTARKLITSITPAKTEDVNVFANAFTVIVEPRLSAYEWYLAADPNAVDCLYYAYLEGNETLRVNSTDDFNTDSMQYAVRGDFGVAAIDYRGMVKSAGK